MILEVIGLVVLFAGTAVLALWYSRFVPPIETLRQRLPNRVTAASLLLTALIGVWVWWSWMSVSGFARFRFVISVLFNLLIFETFFLLVMRWLRSNVLAILLAGSLVAGMVWLQRSVGGPWVYNATFILATFGATTLLVGMKYLRTGFLVLVGGLWMIFDILGVLYVYPQIYRVADRPNTSFLFPAVASGNITLGSGDFMFLVLMSLVLLRDYGRRAALVHVGVQTLALVITIMVKSRESLFPYLTIMVPLFLLTWWWYRRKRQASLPVTTSAA
jgi:hypothetical protein